MATMTKGHCPKCGGTDIRVSTRLQHAPLQVTAFRGAHLKHYVCVSCGYVEAYVQHQTDLDRIREKWESLG